MCLSDSNAAIGHELPFTTFAICAVESLFPAINRPLTMRLILSNPRVGLNLLVTHALLLTRDDQG
jgi:hypothetical protein